jgi:WW domain-binding protein 2
MFGANYITFEIKPAPDGGLTKGTKAEIRLSDRGILQFWEVLQKPRERAIYERRSMALEEDESLRAYLSLSLSLSLVRTGCVFVRAH